MACVFGEMRTLKAGSRWSPKSIPFWKVPRNSSRACEAEDCWWVPVSSIVSRPAHRIPPVSCTRLFTLSGWPMHASFVTTHHVPTLSRSHTISLYALSHCLALSRSHTESRSLLHQLPHHDGIFLAALATSHIVSLHSPYIWLCVAWQDNLILSHARFDAPFNAQVTPNVAAPTVAAHTLLR